MAQDSLLSASDHIYVINLPDRTDRRQEMERQLTKIGVSFTSPQVTLFPAVRPTDRGEFPSIGSRGCFLSHLGVLRDAAERGFGLILLLEDDVDFTRHFLLRSPMLPAALADCDIVYLGHLAKGPLKERVPPDPACLTAPPTTHLMLAHAIMLRREIIQRLIPFLEAMLKRPGGDPAGGPMHVDGAYSWFREDHPQIETIVMREQWCVQRSSRTDIGLLTWKDRIPFVEVVRGLRNRMRGR